MSRIERVCVYCASSTSCDPAFHAAARRLGEVLGAAGVVVVYGGEGSTSEGEWHEAMNWAGIRRLPLIFVIENNG